MRLECLRRGEGEPLVLLHGIGDSSRVWIPVLAALAEAHECWAIDLPGFGRSPAMADREPTVRALADAVASFMADRGHATFHVAGNSLGGAVALELAVSGEARTACAVCPAGFAEGRERLLLETSLRATHRAAVLARPSLDRLPLPPLVRRFALAHMIFRGQRMPAGDLVDTLRDLALAPGWEATLQQIVPYRFEGTPACPVTVAWGEHDRLLLYGPQSARARDRLPGARHVTLRGCGHIPTWDDPEQVARAVLEATARRSPRPREAAAEPAAPPRPPSRTPTSG